MIIDQVKKNCIPRHVAVIMDGNGRWAELHGNDRIFGHRQGVESVRSVVEGAGELGIEYLTLYAFSNHKLDAANRCDCGLCFVGFRGRSHLRRGQRRPRTLYDHCRSLAAGSIRGERYSLLAQNSCCLKKVAVIVFVCCPAAGRHFLWRRATDLTSAPS